MPNLNSIIFWFLPFRYYRCLRPSVRHQVCARDKSSSLQVRLTKFGSKMQNTLVRFPIVLRGNQPWNSRSNLTKSQIVCLRHYWKYITTIKFPGSHEYIGCLTGMIASWSPSSARICLPRSRLVHSLKHFARILIVALVLYLICHCCKQLAHNCFWILHAHF